MTPERIAEVLSIARSSIAEGYNLTNREIGELLDALDAANAELSRLRSSPAPVVGGVPEMGPALEECLPYTEGCKAADVAGYRLGFRIGWNALASRLPALKPGEVEEVRRLRRVFAEASKIIGIASGGGRVNLSGACLREIDRLRGGA